MANNKLKWVAVTLGILAVFCAGGWFFTSLPHWGGAARAEVEELYRENGEAFGIFDDIPPEDLAAAEAVAAYGLNQQVILPEDSAEAQRRDGAELPSQIALTDISDIAGVAPFEEKTAPALTESPSSAVPMEIISGKAVIVPGQDISSLPEGESKITMISAPIKFFLIKNSDEYKRFKTRARGSYPEVDFTKQMLVVLESDSELPDNIFEIRSAETKDGKVSVTYAVSLFDLDKKINTHAVAAVARTEGDVELKQVL